MPTTTGTSFKGLQLIGLMPAVPSRFLTIQLPTSDRARRLTRMGTVLLTIRFPRDAQPVCDVWKLYGDGLAVTVSAEVPTSPCEVWVSWFRSGIAWTCDTRT